MESAGVKVYGYRWVVLFLFMLINAVIQIHWVSFAPMTGDAAAFYGVEPWDIELLAVSYMIVYIILCVPASYVIDTFGIRVGVGLGAVLTGIFGLMKGLGAHSYKTVLIAQCGLAVAQPFILNAITAISARWFPIEDRATATGLATLSQYLGIILAMVLGPWVAGAYSIIVMLKIYGVISVVSAVTFLVFIRERPPLPPSLDTADERISVVRGFGHIFRQRDMLIALVLFFFGRGMFNAVTTWVEQILAPRGFNSEQAGMIGAAMMIGGVLGAIILPIISDMLRKRKAVLVATMVGVLPGLVGVTFCSGYGLTLVSGFVLGFFIMAAGPIGFQYAAEISYPAPESTSQGIILWVGQVSGIIFAKGMDMFRGADGSMTPFMVGFIVMMSFALILSFMLHESPMMHAHDKTVEKDS